MLCTIIIHYYYLVAVFTEQLIISSSQRSSCVSHNTQQNPGVLNVILPSVRSCQADCICSVLLLANQNCYDFQTCSCISETSFLNSLTVCVSNISHLLICIGNFTDEMNNTNVHFFVTRHSSCIQQNLYYSYRKYVKAIKIISGNPHLIL